MKLNKAYEVSSLLGGINDYKKEQIELIKVKEKIVEMLIMDTNILDEKIQNMYQSIDVISKHFDNKISDLYKLIEKL